MKSAYGNENILLPLPLADLTILSIYIKKCSGEMCSTEKCPHYTAHTGHNLEFGIQRLVDLLCLHINVYPNNNKRNNIKICGSSGHFAFL